MTQIVAILTLFLGCYYLPVDYSSAGCEFGTLLERTYVDNITWVTSRGLIVRSCYYNTSCCRLLRQVQLFLGCCFFKVSGVI